MKRYKQLFGISLLCIGVVLMTVWYALGLPFSNAINFASIALIIIGIGFFVWTKKAESKY